MGNEITGMYRKENVRKGNDKGVKYCQELITIKTKSFYLKPACSDASFYKMDTYVHATFMNRVHGKFCTGGQRILAPPLTFILIYFVFELVVVKLIARKASYCSREGLFFFMSVFCHSLRRKKVFKKFANDVYIL